jgi:hypothetical protein
MNWGQTGVMWKRIKGLGPQYYNKNKKKQMMRGDAKEITSITQTLHM